MNSDLTPEKLIAHRGHNVVIVAYGPKDGQGNLLAVLNVALECEDCCVVLADCEGPESPYGEESS